ncbi:Hypothetical predicted protein [Paramuricea clavata]|uniref:Uncharacterized protein n=1 Tax=Paramuricea clavata TaxID=317549 RepID=A0A7D9I161_PARCT|nr:Hypothetical predicted protein [Paramuricea clavata]
MVGSGSFYKAKIDRAIGETGLTEAEVKELSLQSLDVKIERLQNHTERNTVAADLSCVQTELRKPKGIFDPLSNWVLKDYAPLLSSPVTSIFNASLQQASVPGVWEKADVIPVPKNKVLRDITKDLRPISLTATLSKTCERFVADWLMELIGEKIDKRQFGSLKTLQQHMHY